MPGVDLGLVPAQSFSTISALPTANAIRQPGMFSALESE